MRHVSDLGRPPVGLKPLKLVERDVVENARILALLEMEKINGNQKNITLIHVFMQFYA